MKKTAQRKRSNLTITNIFSPARRTALSGAAFSPGNLRRLLAAIFIYALVFAPLTLPGSPGVPLVAAQVGNSCGESPDQIFQNCPFGPAAGSVPQDLTNQAISDVIEFYKLPATQASRAQVLQYARNEIRSMLYARLLTLLRKQTPTNDERNAINGFLEFSVKSRRVLAAQKALEEYNKWTQTGCTTFQPPAPYTYEIPGGCNRLAGFFSPPKPPSFEEFQAFGAARAYGDLFTPQAQDVSQKTTAGIVVGVGAGSAALGGAAAFAAGSALTFGALSPILPYAGTTLIFATSTLEATNGTVTTSYYVSQAILPSAAQTSGSVGGSAVAGPAAIVILAITAAVMEGIAVGNASPLPGKLQEALNNAQNQTLTQADLNFDDAATNQEIYGAFLRATLPDFPGAGAPAPSPSDLSFTVRTDGASGTGTSSTIT